eukprot:sb/3476514/
MASNQDAVNHVWESVFTQLWRTLCGDYINFGYFSEECSNMTEANDNFVNWIIKKVGINESSRLLEIGTRYLGHVTGFSEAGTSISCFGRFLQVNNTALGNNICRDRLKLNQSELVI